MSDADRDAANAWMAYMDRVRAGEISLEEANRLADADPATRPSLDKHALAWRMRGFPIYDNPEDEEPSGFVDTAEWRWADLTVEERAEIQRRSDELAASANLTADQALAFTLGEMGVSCPHRWTEDLHPHLPPWRECSICHVAEQLPGVVVEIGPRTLRVPDPPPPTFRLPRKLGASALMASDDAAPELSIVYDEYRWDGRRYELAPR